MCSGLLLVDLEIGRLDLDTIQLGLRQRLALGCRLVVRVLLLAVRLRILASQVLAMVACLP